jgi:hemolysin type calcium-binding protein
VQHVKLGGAIALAISVIATSLTAATAAQADTQRPVWKCRASAGYTVLNGGDRLEPVVANGNVNTARGQDPDRALCGGGESGGGNLPAPLGVASDLLAASTASAITSIAPEVGAALEQKVRASGRVEKLTLRLPQGGAVAIGVTAADSQASAECVEGKPQLAGASHVTGLTLAGITIDADQLGPALARALSLLGPSVKATANEMIRTPGSLTVRALHIVVALGDRTLVDEVLAESKVGFDGDVCSDLVPSPLCPDGSLFSARRNLCIIPGSQSGTGLGDIIVGRPFQGPSGGTVVPLDVARKRYGNSPCLSGPGPRFAQVDVKRRNRMTGRNSADRMLGLAGNDRMDGSGGNDCMDGGSGGDNMLGAIGNDRLFGSSGADHLNGSLGNDYLSGGKGDDTINAGFGRDRAFGGPGRDYINIATAGPPANANCGSGSDKIRFNNNERRRISGCETRYPLKDR